MRQTSTLRGLAHEQTPIAIAAEAREQAQTATAALGPKAAQHASALGEFAELVRSRSRDDQRLFAMSVILDRLRCAENYEPGPRQRSLLARLGVDSAPPLADATLNELVACAVVDLVDALNAEVAQARRDTTAVEVVADELKAAREETVTARRVAEEACAAAEEAEARAEDLRKQVDHLIALVGDGPDEDSADAEDGDAAAEGEDKPRRIHLDGHTGIYYRDLESGQRQYEISYRDDERRRRWLVTGPDLQEAIKARSNLHVEAAKEATK